MYQRLFPDRDFPITWYAYVEPNGRSPFLKFMEHDLTVVRRMKVIARMHAFAESNWRSLASYAKQIEAPTQHTVYEIKSHQDRVLFIRCRADAIAINGFTKKDDWSKKDASTLKASIRLVDEAVRECKDR